MCECMWNSGDVHLPRKKTYKRKCQRTFEYVIWTVAALPKSLSCSLNDKHTLTHSLTHVSLEHYSGNQFTCVLFISYPFLCQLHYHQICKLWRRKFSEYFILHVRRNKMFLPVSLFRTQYFACIFYSKFGRIFFWAQEIRA